MENRYYLYRHVRLDKNEVFYIGIGTKPNIIKGVKTEYSRAYFKGKRSKFWNNIVNKSDYKVQIIFECNNYDLVGEKEKEFIKLYGRKDLGTGTLVNMTDGGEGSKGLIFSSLHKSKISKALIGKKRSEKQKKNHSNFMLGTKHALGHKLSEECKKRIQEKMSSLIVYQYDLQDNFIEEFYSSREACRKYSKFNRSCIIRVCKGDKKTHGGYKWSYTKK